MADYTDDIAGALEQIQDAGAVCVWTTRTNTTPADSEAPHIPGDVTPVTHDVYAVVLPFDGYARQTFSLEGKDVPEKYAYALMGAVAFTPAVTDTLTDATGNVWRVEALSIIAPSGDPILYTVLLAA